MLQLQQLTVKRGGQTVIKPLTLSLAAGQLVVVCGPNGCGKSTWLNALAGELPFSGQALWQQHDLARWSGRMRAQQVVMLPQNTPLNFAFSVQEVVALGRLPYNEPAWQSGKLARECLSLVDMHSAAHKAYPALSGGQQQRVQLARILAQLGTEHTAPKLLLLDEPTSALDLAHQHQCLTLAKQRAHSGDLVLVVLHDLNLAARYADQLLLLHQGELVAQGTPAQVLTAEHLYQVYGYRAHCVAAEPPQHFVVY